MFQFDDLMMSLIWDINGYEALGWSDDIFQCYTKLTLGSDTESLFQKTEFPAIIQKGRNSCFSADRFSSTVICLKGKFDTWEIHLFIAKMGTMSLNSALNMKLEPS